MTGDDLGNYPLVVEVDGLTYDEDDPNETLKPYVMTAPIPENLEADQVITPITTLVQNQIESDPNLDKTEAADLVKTQLGVAANVDLFEDFVAQDSQEYDLLHATARVIANTMADSQELMKTAAEDAGLSFEEVKAEIVQLVVQDVMAQLETIVAPVVAAQEAAGDDFDPAEFDIEEVEVEAPSVENITEQVEEAAVEIAAGSFQSIIQGEGYHWFDAWSRKDNNGDTEVELEYGIVTDPEDDGNLFEINHEFDWDTSQWVTEDNNNDAEYHLTANGWIETTDGPEGETISYRNDDSVSVTDGLSGYTEIIRITVKDIAGLPLRPVLGDLADLMLKNTTATFREGALGYKASFATEQDQYIVENWIDDQDPDYDHNRLRYWVGNTEVPVTSLAEAMDIYAYDSNNHNYIWIEDGGLQFADDGVLKVFESNGNGQMALAGTGSYEELTAHGKTLLMLNIPVYLREDPTEIRFLTEWTGNIIKTGFYIPAGSIEMDDEFGGNAIAFADLMDNLNTSGVYAKGHGGTSFIQARNYEDNSKASDSKAYLAYDNLTGEDLQSVISQVELTDGTSLLGTGALYEFTYNMHDCRSGDCIDKGSFNEQYAWFNIPGELSAGDYLIQTTLSDSTVLTNSFSYPGDMQLPFIDSSTRTSAWDNNDNLVLTWSLPSGSNSAEIDQIRVNIKAPQSQNDETLMFKLAADATAVSIPANLLADFGVTPGNNPNNAVWSMQTRAYDASGKNYARGASESIVLPGGNSSVQPTPPQLLPFEASDFNDQTVYNIWPEPQGTVGAGGWDAVTIALASNGSATGLEGAIDPTATPDVTGITWSIDSDGRLHLVIPGQNDVYYSLTARQSGFFEACVGETASQADSCSNEELIYTDLNAAIARVAVQP